VETTWAVDRSNTNPERRRSGSADRPALSGGGWRAESAARGDLHQPTHLRALRQMRIQGLCAAGSPLVQLIWMLRNTRSGCGMSAVKRPSAVVTAVRPPGLPLGLNGYCSVALPALSTKRMAAMALAGSPRCLKLA